MKFILLFLALGVFNNFSCNECNELAAYDFVKNKIKAGILEPEATIFLSIDSAVIIKVNEIYSITSSYVRVSKWSIDSTDFYYKVRCNNNKWEVLEKETTSRFYKIKKDTKSNATDEFFSDTSNIQSQ